MAENFVYRFLRNIARFFTRVISLFQQLGGKKKDQHNENTQESTPEAPVIKARDGYPIPNITIETPVALSQPEIHTHTEQQQQPRKLTQELPSVTVAPPLETKQVEQRDIAGTSSSQDTTRKSDKNRQGTRSETRATATKSDKSLASSNIKSALINVETVRDESVDVQDIVNDIRMVEVQPVLIPTITMAKPATAPPAIYTPRKLTQELPSVTVAPPLETKQVEQRDIAGTSSSQDTTRESGENRQDARPTSESAATAAKNNVPSTSSELLYRGYRNKNMASLYDAMRLLERQRSKSATEFAKDVYECGTYQGNVAAIYYYHTSASTKRNLLDIVALNPLLNFNDIDFDSDFNKPSAYISEQNAIKALEFISRTKRPAMMQLTSEYHHALITLYPDPSNNGDLRVIYCSDKNYGEQRLVVESFRDSVQKHCGEYGFTLSKRESLIVSENMTHGLVCGPYVALCAAAITKHFSEGKSAEQFRAIHPDNHDAIKGMYDDLFTDLFSSGPELASPYLDILRTDKDIRSCISVIALADTVRTGEINPLPDHSRESIVPVIRAFNAWRDGTGNVARVSNLAQAALNGLSITPDPNKYPKEFADVQEARKILRSLKNLLELSLKKDAVFCEEIINQIGYDGIDIKGLFPKVPVRSLRDLNIVLPSNAHAAEPALVHVAPTTESKTEPEPFVAPNKSIAHENKHADTSGHADIDFQGLANAIANCQYEEFCTIFQRMHDNGKDLHKLVDSKGRNIGECISAAWLSKVVAATKLTQENAPDMNYAHELHGKCVVLAKIYSAIPPDTLIFRDGVSKFTKVSKVFFACMIDRYTKSTGATLSKEQAEHTMRTAYDLIGPKGDYDILSKAINLNNCPEPIGALERIPYDDQTKFFIELLGIASTAHHFYVSNAWQQAQARTDQNERAKADANFRKEHMQRNAESQGWGTNYTPPDEQRKRPDIKVKIAKWKVEIKNIYTLFDQSTGDASEVEVIAERFERLGNLITRIALQSAHKDAHDFLKHEINNMITAAVSLGNKYADASPIKAAASEAFATIIREDCTNDSKVLMSALHYILENAVPGADVMADITRMMRINPSSPVWVELGHSDIFRQYFIKNVQQFDDLCEDAVKGLLSNNGNHPLGSAAKIKTAVTAINSLSTNNKLFKNIRGFALFSPSEIKAVFEQVETNSCPTENLMLFIMHPSCLDLLQDQKELNDFLQLLAPNRRSDLINSFCEHAEENSKNDIFMKCMDNFFNFDSEKTSLNVPESAMEGSIATGVQGGRDR